MSASVGKRGRTKRGSFCDRCILSAWPQGCRPEPTREPTLQLTAPADSPATMFVNGHSDAEDGMQKRNAEKGRGAEMPSLTPSLTPLLTLADTR